MIRRKFSRALRAASTVAERIVPVENVSRPRSTPLEASSMVRTDRFAAISPMTRRMALAPMSRTAIRRGAGAAPAALAAGDVDAGGFTWSPAFYQRPSAVRHSGLTTPPGPDPAADPRRLDRVR